MNRLETIEKLFKYGWKLYSSVNETVEKMDENQLNALKRLYAAFHGLSSVQDVADSLEEPRFCKHPDTMPVRGQVCKWPDGNITWDIVQVPNQFTKERYATYITEALNRWAKVAGIKPQYTPGNPKARILIGVRSIDGRMGVLAESELPCGQVAQCHQWYDTGENWGAFDGATGEGDIDIIRVATHELGHALGMNHIGAGNLLAPIYSRNIWTPQSGDTQEMVSRYGNPVVPPTDPPATGENYVVRFTDGKLTVDGYRLEAA